MLPAIVGDRSVGGGAPLDGDEAAGEAPSLMPGRRPKIVDRKGSQKLAWKICVGNSVSAPASAPPTAEAADGLAVGGGTTTAEAKAPPPLHGAPPAAAPAPVGGGTTMAEPKTPPSGAVPEDGDARLSVQVPWLWKDPMGARAPSAPSAGPP